MADEKCILDPQRDCLGLQKANMLEKQISEWREASRSTHKELFNRMRELEKAEAAGMSSTRTSWGNWTS